MTRALLNTCSALAIATLGGLYAGPGVPPHQASPTRTQEKEPNTAPPEFEITSVKPAQPAAAPSRGGSGPWNIKTVPGMLVMTNVTLRILIHYAYGLSGYAESDNRISGGPPWIDSATFDITAKAPGAATREQLNLMLRPLLADRFQLKFHWSTKEATQYTLVVGKGGPKFREADPAQPSPSMLGKVTMKQFAALLAGSSLTDYSAPLDKTGLNGTYDLGNLMAQPRSSGVTMPDWWVESMPEQLGLELKREKGTAQILVIDHAEKPAGN